MQELENLVVNNISIRNGQYVTIIGSNPSKGARSPLLWNAAFREFGIPMKMHPLDVERDNIENLLAYLENDSLFRGSAVAAPYKTFIAEALQGNITSQAKSIGAINCIFRDKEGKLKGTNTDGEAALKCIINKVGSLNNKNIMIFGFGGVSKAVCGYLSSHLSGENNLYVVSRSKNINDSQKEKLKITKVLSFDDFQNYLFEVDIVINCTSVGWSNQVNESPINLKELSLLKKSAFVYDVIYQPLRTKLLDLASSINILTENGLEMNLKQAILAFKYVMPDIIKSEKEYEQLTSAMQNA